MGYRSDVCMIIGFLDLEAREAFKSKLLISNPAMLKILNSRFTGVETKYFKFQAFDTKWYDDFDDVKQMNQLWEYLGENLHTGTEDRFHGACYIILGEGPGDISKDYIGGGGHDLAYITQGIEVNI